MDKFLKFTKASIQAASVNKFRFIHAVIGNEACDLDSTTCALVYAFFKYKTSEDPSVLYLPILNIQRSEFPLRTETNYFLRKLGVPRDCLIFRDEISLHTLRNERKLKITLVDHYMTTGSDVELNNDVVQIIDHRHCDKRFNDGIEVNIEPVGSCSTLVAECLIKDNRFHLDQLVSSLLYGTIIMDTINFDEKSKRFTSKDVAIVEELERSLPWMDRKTIYNELMSAKLDCTALSNEEILRKDLKFVSTDQANIAISSVHMAMKQFLQRPNLESDLHEFMSSHRSDGIIIMSVNQINDLFERQIAVYATSDNVREKIVSEVMVSSGLNLDLTPIVTHCDVITAFEQGNTAVSRKQILPVVKKLLASKMFS